MQDAQNDLRHHADLVDRMSAALGIDLQEAAISGRVRIDELSDAVLACTGCSAPDHCGTWLRRHPAGGASTAPGFCRNGRLFARLGREGAS